MRQVFLTHRLLGLSGYFENKGGNYILGDSLKGNLREYDAKTIEILTVNTTLAPSIHRTYEETISIEQIELNGEKQFYQKILKPGRTIVQFTYLADGVKKTTNVYYVTGFLNDETYLLYHKTVNVQ